MGKIQSKSKKARKVAEHLINNIDPYDFNKEEYLGSTIYSKVLPWASCIYVRFLFNLGAMHDPKDKEGVAHFMEHMLFSGTPTYPTKFDIDQFSKLNTLDSMNAFTSFGHLCLNYRCISEHFESALKGSVEMLTKSLLTKESVLKEKSIIIQEAWGVYKNQTRIEYIKKHSQNLFKDFPNRLRISSALGWPDTIARIEQEDISNMFKKGLVRENLSVIISGQLSNEHKKLLKKYIQNIPSGTKSKDVQVPKNIHSPNERVWIHTYEEMGLASNNQAFIEISAAIPRGHKDYTSEAEIVTRAVLYELLFQELRHKNSWCYKVNAGFGNAEDYTFGGLSSSIDPNYVHEAIDIIEGIISRILNGEHVKEFDQEKSLCIERKKAVELTTEEVTQTIVRSLRYEKEIQTRKVSFKNLNAVAFSDVQRVLKNLFIDSKNKIYEIHVPNGYDKGKTYEYLNSKLQVRSLS